MGAVADRQLVEKLLLQVATLQAMFEALAERVLELETAQPRYATSPAPRRANAHGRKAE